MPAILRAAAPHLASFAAAYANLHWTWWQAALLSFPVAILGFMLNGIGGNPDNNRSQDVQGKRGSFAGVSGRTVEKIGDSAPRRLRSGATVLR
jgi:hypothetical protein